MCFAGYLLQVIRLTRKYRPMLDDLIPVLMDSIGNPSCAPLYDMQVLHGWHGATIHGMQENHCLVRTGS